VPLIGRALPILAAAAVSLVVTYPVYLWSLEREAERSAAFELAQFDESCRLARLRLSYGGEPWSSRIVANRCEARGR
jgi:hypothetical protein